MPFFYADSITFHYLDVGQGLPFVFQHGLGGDVHQTQDLFVPPLPFRLLTLDCRGHGETRPVGDPAYLGFTPFADDLVALLDMLHLQQVVVGGISMGAAVALNFALRYPQWVQALVLVRPAWLHEPLPSESPGVSGAPHRRQLLSATRVVGTDGTFHAHLAYPKPRKRRATIACEDGHVGGSHRSFGWSVQDMYGECHTA